MDAQELYRRMAELSEQRQPFVVAMVIESLGSAPGKAGAKMIVLSNGDALGTVGGGKVEYQAVADSLDALREGVSRVVHYDLLPEGEHALGMVCGGKVSMFLDVSAAADTLVVIGAGHIGQKLSAMAKLAGFRVVVLDERPEFANMERFPDADEIVVGEPGRAGELLRVDSQTHVVILTHSHLQDKEALRAAIATDAAYVGMIGSRTKVRTLFGELEWDGIPPELLARVHAPIGLELGGGTPGEIAVSILAEIIAERHGASSARGARRP